MLLAMLLEATLHGGRCPGHAALYNVAWQPFSGIYAGDDDDDDDDDDNDEEQNG